MELAFELMMGVSLAACAGLRAFLPLLLLGLIARFTDHVELGRSYQWLASDPALIVFGSATLIEVAADKWPALDNVLDALQSIVRPLAGVIAASAVLEELSPLTATIVGLVLGAPVAAKVHLTKAGVRLVSTHTTLGLANPLVSVAEDVTSLAGSTLAAFLPPVAFALAVLGLYLAFRLSAKVRRELRAVRDGGRRRKAAG
ncbi:MAG: DUF4126 domain-containing protein [Armatimonadota bacterium]